MKTCHTIKFRVRQDSKHIVFDVSDNGVGMDPEVAEKVFTPFFSTKGRKGTGLGLFISNKIIEQHGGEIQIKTHANQGTLFSIKIPKIPPELEKRRPKATSLMLFHEFELLPLPMIRT